MFFFALIKPAGSPVARPLGLQLDLILQPLAKADFLIDDINKHNETTG